MLACQAEFSFMPDMSDHTFCYSFFRTRTRALRWLFISLWLALAAGCGSAPVQEMSEARQAIEAARAAGAEQSARQQYEKAQQLLETAEQLLNDEHFNRARKSAEQARDEAIQARETAQRESVQ